MATFRMLSAYNGFVPEATGEVVAFVRKESEFPLNRYVKYISGPKVGLYVRLGRDDGVRVVSDEEFAWEDGDERPSGDGYQGTFESLEYRTFRRNYAWKLGYGAIENTTLWKPKMAYMDYAISRAMTNRTKRVITLLETAGNWEGNTDDANTLNGGAGPWNTGSDDPTDSRFEAIYKSLVEAARRINLATNGKVKPGVLQCVVSPGLAIAMSTAPEIINYVRETPQAREIIEKGLDPTFELWGLPGTYRGFKFVVEDSPIVTSRPKASGVEATAGVDRTYIKSDTSCAMMARPGGLDGEYGSKDFSTMQLYYNKDLLRVQVFDDPENERVKGHVSEDVKEILAAPVSGYLITATK